jgi:hypothetical protein
MNKTISINPDLFKLSSDKKTRKKAPTKPNTGEIKIRQPSSGKRKQQNLRRNHVLRFIRDQQEKNYKRLIEGDTSNKKKDVHDTVGDFDSDFDSSLKYLSALEETPASYSTNHTLRNRVSTNENVSLNFPSTPMNEPTILPTHKEPPIHLAPPVEQPRWGCLKNGSLPTYRNWKNVTQRTTNEIRKTTNIAVLKKKKKNLHYPKQKRTIRRNFTVGRCKTKPIIGVLVSNRTIRNNTTTKTQLMKQTPIEEVRRYLVKKGFIKVGSIAPNDVLRKMHETASLMCGEIENHNPENLLYNYFHDAVN